MFNLHFDVIHILVQVRFNRVNVIRMLSLCTQNESSQRTAFRVDVLLIIQLQRFYSYMSPLS